MTTSMFVCRSRFPVSAAELFAWHGRPGALERLLPPWGRATLLERSGGIKDGSRTVLRVPWIGPFKRRWVAEHGGYAEGRQFTDIQLQGPFASWEHKHLFEPDGANASILEDRIEYALPLGFAGRLLGGRKVRRILRRAFAYRHAVLSHDLALHAGRPDPEPWKILVTGATGLVGAALVSFLTSGGHEVIRLGRRPAFAGDLSWDQIDPHGNLDRFEGFDAVIHLAGESIARGRWTAAKKERIRASRVDNTRRLCETLARLASPPRVLLCASAVGYYGNRGDELLDETSALGTGFLAEVCRDWEAAAAPARTKGIRVAHLRFGVVLSAGGGALAAMLTPFRLGLGGKIGNGRQYMSWIALDDLLGVVHLAMFQDNLEGPINVVAPEDATNRVFTKALGRVLWRPTILPMPAFASRLAFGEMADEALMASQRAVPLKLMGAAFSFSFPTLEAALRHCLGKNEIVELVTTPGS